MLNHKRAIRLLTFVNLAILLGTFSFPLAQQVTAKNRDNPDVRLPIRRASGGTRRECIQPSTPSSPSGVTVCPALVALMPESVVTTTKTSPTLFFFVPALKNYQTVQVEFVLRDQNDQLVYETTFKTTGQAGVISFKLPKTTQFSGLASAQQYHWYLSVIYNPLDRSHDDVVEGLLAYQPLESSLKTQLDQATPLEKVSIYQNNNLWYEALNTLAELRQIQPQDQALSQKWTELLKSVDLDSLAQEPLINGIQEFKSSYPSSPLISHR